ncbi:MAG: NUDIX hydrolase [Planctomycetota bacterium]
MKILPLRRPPTVVVAGPRPARDPGIAERWRAATEANPRLFDGPILAITAIDAASATLHARLDRFAHLVCPRAAVVPVSILSITGIIEAQAGRRPVVLAGRRGRSTRSYPGMWEFGPSGGLEAADDARVLGQPDLLRTLRRELHEEVGIAHPLRDARVVGIVPDPGARSVDVLVRARLEGDPPPLRPPREHAWEYDEARWIPIADLPAFLDHEPVIGPMIATARWLGWA